MKPFVSILWFGGSDSLGDWFEGKEQNERENQPKKSLKWQKPNIYELGMEIRRETREDKKKNEILKSYLRDRTPNTC